VIDPLPERIPNNQRWYRVADDRWDDPLDPSFARVHGGRWNPAGSFPTLYLNEDVDTARGQIVRMLEGSPINPEDLDPPFVLVTIRLPVRQTVADAVTSEGLGQLGLPDTYPVDDSGSLIPRERCQPIGAAVKLAGLRGVHARSVTTRDGSGRELAWFPARNSSRARRVGPDLPFAEWW